MAETLSPMMQQYQRLRKSVPADALLLFRLGDFYELFFEDAKEASGLLNLALTKRNGVPMCGMPYHAAQTYIAKLIKAGRRVAVCDQTSEPQPGKIVSRDITQIITAGTISELHLLEAKRANYLGAVYVQNGSFGFAYADLSTGEFRLAQVSDRQTLLNQLARVGPAELLVSEDQAEQVSGLGNVISYDSYAFLPEQSSFTLCEHFKTKSLDGFGCSEMPAAVGAAGGIVHYLKHQLRRKIDHLTSLRCEAPTDFVALDVATQTNLELVASRGEIDVSLLSVLDRTNTPMGGRRLRAWILQPLRDLKELGCRQQMIADLLREPDLLGSVRTELKVIRDFERAIGRLSQASGNARDLAALKFSLEELPKLKAEIAKLIERLEFGIGSEGSPERPQSLAARVQSQIHEMPELAAKLGQAVVDEPPLPLKEGGIFRDGYDADLDELRRASHEGKKWIADLQEREIEVTGIKSLKVRFNSVFGYFIEITKSNLAQAPAHYTRKQTTVGGERFITPELKEMEAKILGADERSRNLEYQLFQKLREETLQDLGPIQETAGAIAVLDAICALAETARLFNYCRPALTESRVLSIKDGRHPVLDQNLLDEKFVPNDTELDGDRMRLAIITGPNMAGKSTYIRQVALIVLMAQIGSFVPALAAEIGLVDRIFTRVGANDDLARGQSTFMVEMNETANIVNNATDRSLVILDEIGRGTSTFDGLSIAWSVAEFLHDKIKARTLFATHYHELTKLAEQCSGVCNFNVAVREWNEQIIFLRKIIPGGADKSYGIQVARLAGLPKEILDRAKDILSHLENPQTEARPAKAKKGKGKKNMPTAEKPQMDLLSMLRLLAHPLTRGLDLDSPQTTVLRRQIVREKEFLRRVYEEWYALIHANLPPVEGGVLELGSGAGFMESVIDGLITSEVFPTPGARMVLDGTRLPFPSASLRAIVMTDVFHHIAAPRAFLAEARRSLVAGGRIVMVEPWVTRWSRLVFRRFHHEPFEPEASTWEFSSSGPLSGANGALPWIVFDRDRAVLEREFPELRVADIRPLMPMAYLWSGGVGMRAPAPGFAYRPWRALEGASAAIERATAMFALIVVERR